MLFFLLTCSPGFADPNSYGEIGVQLYRFPKPKIAKEVTIINVFPGSPAWNSGIRTADRIIKVDDIDVTNSTPAYIYRKINGNPGETVKLTLKTKSGIKDFNVTKEVVDPNQYWGCPIWAELCADQSSGSEICFIHVSDKVNKKFELGQGPLAISLKGRKIALVRYAFENSLLNCQQSENPERCYMRLREKLKSRL